MALKKNPRFDLKLHYKRTLEIGMIFSLCLLLAAFKYFPDHEVEKVKKEYWEPDVNVEDIQHTKQDELKIPKPPEPKPLIDEILPEDEILDDIEFDDNSIDENANMQKPKEYKEKNIAPEPEPIFEAVEKLPEIIGGMNSLYEKIYYPEVARRVGIEGRVIVQAVVSKTGKVVDLKILKGIGGGCDEVALEAVNALMFYPGEQRGRSVNVRISIPIQFKLQN